METLSSEFVKFLPTFLNEPLSENLIKTSEEFLDGDSNFLVKSFKRREGSTSVFSIGLPVFLLKKNPTLKILVVTFAHHNGSRFTLLSFDLAQKNNIATRYQRGYDWVTQDGGCYFTLSNYSLPKFIGRSFDYIICDNLNFSIGKKDQTKNSCINLDNPYILEICKYLEKDLYFWIEPLTEEKMENVLKNLPEVPFDTDTLKVILKDLYNNVHHVVHDLGMYRSRTGSKVLSFTSI